MCKRFLILLCCSLSMLANATAVKVVTQQQLLEPQDQWLILDVRTPEEYRNGHIAKAINIPYDQIAGELDKLKHHQKKTIVVYCRSGRRAGIAVTELHQYGFTDVRHLKGDMLLWQENKLPLVKGSNKLSN